MHTVHVAKQTSDGTAGEQAVAASGVNFHSTLASKRLGSSANRSAGCDHVVHDGDRFSIHVQIFGLVDDGVSVDSRFLKVGKLTADLLSHAGRSVDGAFVG